MIKKAFVGLVASTVFFILPAWLFVPRALYDSKLWIMLLIGVLASTTQPAYSPLDPNAPPEDRGTAKQLVWTVYIALIIGAFESLLLRYPESMTWDSLSLIFLLVCFLGITLRAWAVIVLGKFFSWHVSVQPEQEVIRTGPYKFIRHPAYTGAWLLYVSCLFFIHAWFAGVLCGVFLLAAFTRRITYEEKLMLQTFGDGYESYSSSVKRLIPMVW